MVAEVSRLGEDRLGTEGGAILRTERLFEVVRCQEEGLDWAQIESGKKPRLERCADPLEVGGSLATPVDAAAVDGYGGEDVEALLPRRGQRRIGAGGGVQVERELLRQHLSTEEIVQQPP